METPEDRVRERVYSLHSRYGLFGHKVDVYTLIQRSPDGSVRVLRESRHTGPSQIVIFDKPVTCLDALKKQRETSRQKIEAVHMLGIIITDPETHERTYFVPAGINTRLTDPATKETLAMAPIICSSHLEASRLVDNIEDVCFPLVD